MEIVWTKHAEERQKKWARRRGITLGDQDALVAQVRREGGLLRAPFIETKGRRKILTVYWTSKAEKYWKEERNADSI